MHNDDSNQKPKITLIMLANVVIHNSTRKGLDKYKYLFLSITLSFINIILSLKYIWRAGN